MKNLAFFSALVLCLVFGAVFFIIQNPMMLSGGSDSLEIHVTPGATQSWLSLIAFAALAVALRFSGWFSGKWGTLAATGLVLISLGWIAINSHSFTISGRQHAFVDRWFLAPTNIVTFDPTGDISEYIVIDDGFLHSSISIKGRPESEMVVVTGLLGSGIDRTELTADLEKFGLTSP